MNYAHQVELSFLCGTVALAGSALGAEGTRNFAAEGTLTSDYYEQGVLSSSLKKPFACEFSDCRGFIRIQYDAGDIAFHEYVSDSTNSYNLTRFSDSLETRKVFNSRTRKMETLDVPIKPKNSAKLIIGPTLVPHWSKDFVIPIWLAYASGCVLPADSGDEMMPPIYPLGENTYARRFFAASGLEVRTSWRKNPLPPFFTSELDVHRGGRLYWHLDALKEVPAPETMKAHDITYSFRVSEWTNIAGMTYPIVFNVVKKTLAAWPPPRTKEPAFNKSVIQFRVTSISPTSPERQFASSMPSNTLIIDERVPFPIKLSPVQGIDYHTTNGTVLSPAKVRQLSRYKFLERDAVALARQRHPNWLIMLLFMFIIVLPAIGVVRNQVSKKKGKNP